MIRKINKKGDIAVTLFVWIAVVLFLATLFSFLSNSKGVSVTVQDSSFVDEAYAKENEIEYYVFDIGRKILDDYESFEGSEEEKREKILEEFPDRFRKDTIHNVFLDVPLLTFFSEVETMGFDFVYVEEKDVFLFTMEDFVIVGDLVDEGSVIVGNFLDEEVNVKRLVWRRQPVDYSQESDEIIGGIIYRTDLEVEFDLDKVNKIAG